MKSVLKLARTFLLAAISLVAILAGATGAAAQVVAVQGGTVHTPDGAIEATVLLRDGMIEAVGGDVQVPSDAETIDASGLHVYPGMFDAFSRLGLTEIGSIGATEDIAEMGEYNPHLQAATAVHPASELIPVARANGITHALAAPGSSGGFGGGGGSVMPGQAALMHLDGWTIEEMAIDAAAALIVDWPSLETRTFDFATFSVKDKPFSEAEKEYDEKLDGLRDWIDAARHYRQATERGDASKFERDLKLEALVPVLAGDRPILVVADQAKEIRDSVAFAEREGLRMILASGDEAWKEKELLAEKGIPVILGPIQRLPGGDDEAYDQPFRAPAELVEAGITVAMASFNASSSRRLPYYAAMAVGGGLDREQAWAMVTVNGARIFGLEDELGTIEQGKRANLIVTDGDPLEITTEIEHLIIDGREVSTDNKHLRSYERYRGRPTS